MKKLIGREIRGLRVSPDAHVLAFDTDAGPVVYEAHGDCCSEAWFADIIGVECLLKARIREVRILDLSSTPQDDRCRQETDAFYGCTLVSGKGCADIIFRCSSNGYYGGYTSLCNSRNDEATIIIKEDWSA